jgi:hypothetical protein
MSATISAQFAFTLKRPHITRPFAVGVQACEAIAAVFAEGGVYHWPDIDRLVPTQAPRLYVESSSRSRSLVEHEPSGQARGHTVSASGVANLAPSRVASTL